MKETYHSAGEIIYREGDPGDSVYIIQDGQVEVLRDIDGENVCLAVLRKGAIFGEAGVLREKPRSTTTRALDAVSLVRISKETFLSTFRRDSPLALPLLRMLCDRLAQLDDRLPGGPIAGETARMDEVARIRLLPAGPEMETQIGSDGIEIGELPYRVGRQPRPGEPPHAASSELALRSQGSEQLSIRHFSIAEHDGVLVFQDLGSHLGTLVNGLRVAHFEQSDTAGLVFGENIVQAGGIESPYRFRVIVERAAR